MDKFDLFLWILYIIAIIFVSFGFYDIYSKNIEREKVINLEIAYNKEFWINENTLVYSRLKIKKDGRVIKEYSNGTSSNRLVYKISKDELLKLNNLASSLLVVNSNSCEGNNKTIEKIKIMVNVGNEEKTLIFCNNSEMDKDVDLFINELEKINKKLN